MKCFKCGSDNEIGSVFCDHCAAPLVQAAKPTKGWYGLTTGQKAFFITLGVLLLWGLTLQARKQQTARPPSSVKSVPTSKLASPPAPARPDPPKPPSSAWHYSYNQDVMAGQSIKTASLSSSNTVDFAFPYNGEQHATLILRKRRNSNDIILTIEKGQLICGNYFGRSVSVRFDDKPMRRFKVSEPADHDSTIVFIRNEQTFIAEAKKAKKILIEAIVYQNGSPVFEFNSAGLEW